MVSWRKKRETPENDDTIVSVMTYTSTYLHSVTHTVLRLFHYYCTYYYDRIACLLIRGQAL